MSTEPVRSLFVTLRRSHAGKAWFHRVVLQNFGLTKLHKTVEVANTHSVRGALSKIPHLVTVETDRMYYLRNMKTFYEKLLRPPVQISHGNVELRPVIGSSVFNLQSKHVQQRLKDHAYATQMEGFVFNHKPEVIPDALKPFIARTKRAEKREIIKEKGIFSEEATKIHLEELKKAAKMTK